MLVGVKTVMQFGEQINNYLLKIKRNNFSSRKYPKETHRNVQKGLYEGVYQTNIKTRNNIMFTGV